MTDFYWPAFIKEEDNPCIFAHINEHGHLIASTGHFGGFYEQKTIQQWLEEHIISEEQALVTCSGIQYQEKEALNFFSVEELSATGKKSRLPKAHIFIYRGEGKWENLN